MATSQSQSQFSNPSIANNNNNASSSSQYPDQIQGQQNQTPAHPYHHRPSFSYAPSTSNGASPDQRRDSNNEDWSGGDSAGEQEEQGHGSKKRKRAVMSVSCELCKQRKVKCDRGQPTCGWCMRNNQICEYRERKKPGLRAGYGRELEARLDRLEAVISSQQNTISQLASGAAQAAHQAPPPPHHHETNVFAAGPVPMASDFIERPELPPIQQISNVFHARTPNMVGFRSDYPAFGADYMQPPAETYPKPNLTPLPQETQSHYSAEGQHMATPSIEMATPASNANTQDHDLPPYDLLYNLTDLFFKHVNTWCPILHRRTIFDNLFGTTSLEEADRILLHAIVATTLRFSTDTRLTTETKDRYHQVSKQKVLLYGMENSSVKALQALVILALDLCGTSNGPPSWNLLALIARSAVQLGLSIEATSPSVSPRVQSIYTLRAMVLSEPTSWIEDESRRRLFWMVYIIDRFATVCTAFDFALDEREIDRKLPCRDELFSRNQPIETRWFRSHDRADSGIDRPENLGPFSYYVEVVGILSQVHQFLKKPVDIGALADVEEWQGEYRQLHSALNAWKNSLPKDYSNTARLFDNTPANKAGNNCGWIILHAAYHLTVIRLHSSAAYPARRSPIFSPSFRASQCCLSAVDAISNLCANVKQQHGLLSKLGWPFAFSVWVASRLLLVHSSTIDHNINPNIHFFVTTLRELGTYWPVADRYAELLQRVLDEFAESERMGTTSRAQRSSSSDANNNSGSGNGTGSGDRGTPSSVRILADMRRCAYDLDFLISRQPRLVMGSQLSVADRLAISAGPTPSRTPAPNELEYLDVFDFFNMPRLPMNMDAAAGATAGGSLASGQAQIYGYGGDGNDGGYPPADTQPFVWDVGADWFVPKGPDA